MPSSCKVVKRKAWLNLVKFIDRDAMSRKQSAIILASAAKNIDQSYLIWLDMNSEEFLESFEVSHDHICQSFKIEVYI